jgi:hypothetical protein
MIINKSTHPVEVKRIPIRLWSLRDEIEAAIARRIKECEAAQIPLNIDDIKAFYSLDKSQLAENNVIKLKAVEDAPAESASEEKKAESFDQAEKIIEDQKTTPPVSDQGAIAVPPFERQAPDLGRISYGFALLVDINMASMLLFSKNSYSPGQSIVIEFLIPQHFMLSADVAKANYIGMRSRIISESKPDYRIQCRFNFNFKGERAALRQFLTAIEPNLNAVQKDH